jgi:hypothetical protein
MEHISFELDGHRTTESSWNLHNHERRLRSCRVGEGGSACTMSYCTCRSHSFRRHPQRCTHTCTRRVITPAWDNGRKGTCTYLGQRKPCQRRDALSRPPAALLHTQRACKVGQRQDFVPRVRCDCTRQLLLHACCQCPVQNHMASAGAPIHRNAPTSRQKTLPKMEPCRNRKHVHWCRVAVVFDEAKDAI